MTATIKATHSPPPGTVIDLETAGNTDFTKGIPMSTEQRSSFSFDALTALTITEADHVRVDATSVVVNLDAAPARIHADLGGYIPPLASTILSAGATVSGQLLALIAIPEQPLPEATFRALGWEDFYGSDKPEAHRGTPVLLKSPQDSVGHVDLVPAKVLADPGAPSIPSRYEVKLNLWFSPADTDCGIHREHAFIETHTQLLGIGRMQKFTENTHTSLFEDQILAPGQTQTSIFGRWHQAKLAYPWHQYHADTDVVWLAVEYHALTP